MMTKLKSLITRCLTKSVPQQTGKIQTCQIETMAKSSVTSQVLHDYGYYSCAPLGSIGVCLTARAEEQDRISVVYHPKYYGHPLKETEVILGNFVKDATLKFDEEGNAHLTVPKNIYINCVDSIVTCAGDSTVDCQNSTITAAQTSSVTCDSAMINAGSSFDVSAGASASITAPTIALNGAVSAPQGMAVTGGMTSEGIEVSKTDHTHKAGNLKDSGGGACSGETAPDA